MNNKGKKSYIFLGPPGSGKGTISNLFVKRLGWKQLSTGNLCRQHIAEKTEIGKKIDFDIKSGKLINDDIIIEMVRLGLSQAFDETNSVILDGFPRTVAQAQALQDLLSVSPLDSVSLRIIKMNVSDDVLIQRLTDRVICQNDKCQAVYSLHKESLLNPKNSLSCDECSGPIKKRSDDDIDVIVERLKNYRSTENDLYSFYSEQGYKINDISVENPIEKVYSEILNMLDL